MKLPTYLHNLLVSFDQFCNCILGGLPDETISARAGRARIAGKLWGRALSAVLDWIRPGHVEGAILHDGQRAETVEEIEGEKS